MSYKVVATAAVIPDEKGSFHHFYEGAVLPDSLDQGRVKQLAEEGVLEKVKAAKSEDSGPKPGTVEFILNEVGDDPEKAKAALEAEQAEDKPRSTLVEKLEAIANPSGD